MTSEWRRNVTVALACVAVLVIEIGITLEMLRDVGLQLPVLTWLVLAVLAIAPLLVVGVLGWILVLRFRKQAGAYLRRLISGRWLFLSFLLIGVQVMQTYFYAVLKLSIPLLTARNYDQLLWDIDGTLFFGLSPNVFFLNLFSAKWFLLSIDFGYGYFFFLSVTLAYPFFFAHSIDSLRTAYAASTMFLWSSGAWLYYAVPSLGPCYMFHGVWDELRELFPVTMILQKRLWENYHAVLGIREGVIAEQIDIILGVAAFPSMHVAFQVNLALWLASRSRIWGRVGFFMASVVFVGSVLTGWHYLIDSIAGVLLGWGAYAAAQPVRRWIEGNGAEGEEVPVAG